MKFKSVIFDWDGTLGMTLHLWLEGYRNETKKLGFELSDEEIISDFFYEHDKAAIKYPNINFDLFVPLVQNYINDHISSIKTYPGVYEALNILQNNNITLALVSSSPRHLIKEELKQTGLDKFFKIIVTGDDVMRHKPNPEAFNQIIEIAKLDPETTIILGDSHNDIIASKAAGIKSCLFLPIENKIFYDFNKLKEENPTYSVETLNDFVDIIIKP